MYGSYCTLVGWNTKQIPVMIGTLEDMMAEHGDDIMLPGHIIQVKSKEELQDIKLYAVWIKEGID